MKLILQLILVSLLIYAAGVLSGKHLERYRSDPAPRAPEQVVKEALKLYQENIVLPDSVLIGIPGERESEVYVFVKVEGGLEFVGIFKK